MTSAQKENGPLSAEEQPAKKNNNQNSRLNCIAESAHDSRNTEWVKSLQDAVTPRKLESDFRWVTYSKTRDTKPTVHIGKIEDFVDQVFDPRNLRASKYDCPLFQCIEIKDGATRGNAAVESHTALVIDYDEGIVRMSVAVEFLRAKGFLSILYRSFTSPEDGTKFRVIIPTLRYLSSAEMKVAIARVNQILSEIGMRVSSESFVPGQAFFFGFDKRLAGQPGLTEVVGGDQLLDTDAPDFTAIEPLFPVLVAKENKLRRRLFPDEVEEEIIAMVELAGGKLGTGEGRTELLKGHLIAVKRQNPNCQDEAALTKEAARIVDTYFVNPETMQPERLVDWVLRNTDFEPRSESIAEAFRNAPDASDSSPNPGVKKKSAADWRADIVEPARFGKPVEFLLDGFIPAGVVAIAAPWGAGKTTNLLPVALISAGLVSIPGIESTIRRKVVWFSEDPDQVERILESIQRSDAWKAAEDLGQWVTIVRAKRREPGPLTSVLKDIRDACAFEDSKGFLVRPLVVFDTSSANFEIENENDNAQVARFVAAIRAAQLPVWVIGHTPKALARSDVSDMSFRGAGAWEAEAVATLFLFHDEAIDRRVLALRKRRFSGEAYTELHFGTGSSTELVDVPWDGPQQLVTYIHGVPEIGSAEDRREAREEIAEERRESKKEQAILQQVDQVLATVNAAVGRANWLSRVKVREELGGRKEVVGAAIGRLIDAGLLVEKEVPRSVHSPQGRPPKALLPSGIDEAAFWARVEGRGQGE